MLELNFIHTSYLGILHVLVELFIKNTLLFVNFAVINTRENCWETRNSRKLILPKVAFFSLFKNTTLIFLLIDLKLHIIRM